MKREIVAIVLTLSLITAAVGPALASTHDDAYVDDTISPAAAELDGILSFNKPDYLLTYGADERPGWYITYSEGDRNSVIDWIDSSDERDLITEDTDSRRVLVSAPAPAVLGGIFLDGLRPRWFRTGLQDRSYVETVDVNVRLRYVEPIHSLAGEESWRQPVPNALVRGGWSTDGVAFGDDVNRSNLSAVRTNVSADELDADGSGLTAAVIDTGANIGDGEIYGNGTKNSTIRVTAAQNFITDEEVDVDADDPDWSVVQDGNGHGSWVASAIAANASGTVTDGIAPDADILIAKSLDDDGSGSTQDIIEAIEWSEENGADVISMSLGSPVYSPTLATEIEEALEGNVSLVVLAAGNSRMNPAVRYIASPADAPIEGIVAVAATSNANSSEAESAYFSSVGPDSGTRDFSNGVTAGEGPDVAAPGMAISAPTLTTGGTKQNVTLSGTSMAAPIVSGVVLLALEENPDWSTETLVEEIEATSTPIEAAGTTEVGAGMINASSLIDRTAASDDQVDVRSTDATARDEANAAYSGGRILQFLAGDGESSDS